LSDPAVLTEIELQLAEIPPARQNKETNAHHRQQEHVEHTKEDEAVGDADDVPSVTEAERNKA
jgi:hypothetical protein